MIYRNSNALKLNRLLSPFNQELWIPPVQEASSYNRYTYESLIDAYDALVASHPNYITKVLYSEQSTNPEDVETYNLYHYVFEPETYSKTFLIIAGQHGNEKDAPQSLLRIMQILSDETGTTGYAALAPLRNDVRIIVVPCVSPWGFNHGLMNIPYYSQRNQILYSPNNGRGGLNINRNYDANHAFSLASVGVGGDIPFDVAENRHVRYIVDHFGAENIDFFTDFHDGANVAQHFWINYNMDAPNAIAVRKLVDDLIAYEEANYPQYKDPELGWVVEHCKDHSGYSSGVAANWANNTMGISAGACEYIGGYFGYTFDSEHTTRSLRIRANMLLYNYYASTNNWTIMESENEDFFRWDYPCALTGKGAMIYNTYHNVATASEASTRWDALVTNNPGVITKSVPIGLNTSGDDVYSYSIGNGNQKVLLVGGTLRWGTTPMRQGQHFEMLLYSLARYLCNDHICEQSAILQKLKRQYELIILPFIDYDIAGANSVSARLFGLNSSSLSYKKWKLVDNLCVPNNDSYNDTSTIKAFIDSNSDAVMILSGAENTSAYTGENPKYTTSGWNTQIIEPMNMTDDTGSLRSYLNTLEETVNVDHTTGLTFGDYAYDHYSIPVYYLNFMVSVMWDVRKRFVFSETPGEYEYRNYETGRRLSTIINTILTCGGAQ